jgi:hypothetical protein
LVAGEPKCRSEKLYGRSSPYFLAHNLYFDLRLGTSGPEHLSAPANRKLSWIAELAWQHVSAFREASVTFFTEPQLREWAAAYADSLSKVLDKLAEKMAKDKKPK